jgi:hypothetical protein
MAAKKHPHKIYMPGDVGDSKARREYRKPGPVVIVRKGERKCPESRMNITR